MFEPLPLVVEPPGDIERVSAAAAHAASVWNVPPPVLIRLAANGVFACGDIVIRVSKPTGPMRVSLMFAERLNAFGIRVPRPVQAEPIVCADGLVATAWERIDHNPQLPVDWERVGAIVAAVHTIDPSTVAHPLPFCGHFPWWNFEAMMSEADEVDNDVRAALEGAYRANRWWYDAARSKRLVLCHGDVHPGNVLVDAHGPVLIDWDLLCVAPLSWDHAPLMTWTRRWGGEPGVYEAFSAGYGQRADDDLGQAIAEMRLLAATLMRLQRARVDPAHRDEAMRRLSYWRGDPNAPMWHAQ